MTKPSHDSLKDLVHFLAMAMVDKPELVTTRELDGEQTTVIELEVAPDDVGKVIGKEGRNASALRTIVTALSSKLGRRAVLEIIEPS